jgi:hypothetical protein
MALRDRLGATGAAGGNGSPNQGEPATRAGGWHYLPSLDVSQSKGSAEIITVMVKGATFTPIPLATGSIAGRMLARHVGRVVDTAGANATVGAMPVATTAAPTASGSRPPHQRRAEAGLALMPAGRLQP